MNKLMLALVLVCLQAQAGGPEVLQVSPGVYMAIVKNRAGVFGQPSTTKRKAIETANNFAAERGMVAVPVHLEYTEAAPGRWPAVEYQFRLAPHGDTTSAPIAPGPDFHLHVSSGASGVAEPVPQERPDLHAELIKLDDLRQRGLLTDAEFDAEKKKLLDR